MNRPLARVQDAALSQTALPASAQCARCWRRFQPSHGELRCAQCAGISPAVARMRAIVGQYRPDVDPQPVSSAEPVDCYSEAPPIDRATLPPGVPSIVCRNCGCVWWAHIGGTYRCPLRSSRRAVQS